jgi:dihydroorotate dehydrogenase
MGGVTSAQDVVDLVACGATDVALGTVLFSDPDAPRRIREELATIALDDVHAVAHASEKSLEIAPKVPA